MYQWGKVKKVLGNKIGLRVILEQCATYYLANFKNTYEVRSVQAWYIALSTVGKMPTYHNNVFEIFWPIIGSECCQKRLDNKHR